jgi:uncharacterized protein YcfJ
MKASKHSLRLAWVCCLAGMAGTASGVEFIADADVLSVEPIVRYQTVTRRAEHCVARPQRDAGLVALLSWDLAAGECSRREQREIIEGYRVTYQWDGRRYHQTMAEHPGSTLRVAVRLE